MEKSRKSCTGNTANGAIRAVGTVPVRVAVVDDDSKVRRLLQEIP